MKLFVRVKPSAKAERVERIDEQHFRVWVKSPPQGGQANEAVLSALSGHLDLPRKRFKLLSGHRSRNKTIAV